MSRLGVRVFRQPWAAMPWQAPRAAASCGRLSCTAQNTALAGLKCPHNLTRSPHLLVGSLFVLPVVSVAQISARLSVGGAVCNVQAITQATPTVPCCSTSSSTCMTGSALRNMAAPAVTLWTWWTQGLALLSTPSVLGAHATADGLVSTPFQYLVPHCLQDIQCIHCLGQAAVRPQRE